MNNTIEKIHNAIIEKAVVLNNDSENIFSSGIFYLPELAFTYECAKHLLLKSKHIFGSDKVECSRELKFGDYGINDLVIKHDELYYVFEFKLDNGSDDYVSDIEKLHNTKYGSRVVKIGIFCKCFFDEDKDKWFEQNIKNRITDIRTDYLVSDKFKTEYSKYSRTSYFVISTWHIDSNN